VMAEAGLEFSEDEKKGEMKSSSKPTVAKQSSAKENSLKDYSLDKLNQLLEKAINNEDYEKAARIRDEINKRN